MKDLIKVAIKIGILYRNNQFSPEEVVIVEKFRKKLNQTAMTIVSFYEVEYTFDRNVLSKLLHECKDLVHELVQRHLTPRTHGRINHVFNHFADVEFLSTLYSLDGDCRPNLKKICEGINKLIDEKVLWMPSLLLDFAAFMLRHPACSTWESGNNKKPLSKMPIVCFVHPSDVDARLSSGVFILWAICWGMYLRSPLFASPKDVLSLLSRKATLLTRVGPVHLVEWKEPWTRGQSTQTWFATPSVMTLFSGSWNHCACLPTSQGCCEDQVRLCSCF